MRYPRTEFSPDVKLNKSNSLHIDICYNLILLINQNTKTCTQITPTHTCLN